MFSTIVYSVLLAFALSDIGGSGLAVAAQKSEMLDEGLKCNDNAGVCLKQNEETCRAVTAKAECYQNLKNDKEKDCQCSWCTGMVEGQIKEKKTFKVTKEECVCCGKTRELIGKLGGTLELKDGGVCEPPKDGLCMRCKVDLKPVNDSFKVAKTCESLTTALNQAKQAIAGPGPCTEKELTSYLASQKFVISRDACAFCDKAHDFIAKLEGGTLPLAEGGVCEPPKDGLCKQSKENNAKLDSCFKDKKTCEDLMKAFDCAKKEIKGAGCSDSDLTNYINAQKFVIENVADCHSAPCTSLSDALNGNYTATLKVKNGTEPIECLPESGAFRIGSAIASLLGALGIVLIFKLIDG